MALTRSSTERVEIPCFLDHGGERLLGHPARLQKTRKIRALAQLRDPQFDRSGPGLPVAGPIAIALDQTLRTLLTMASASQRGHFHLHQSLGGKADHLA
jgi:hypothetical protein